MTIMTAREIVRGLASTDPVYETSVHPVVPGTPRGLKKSLVRKCSLCKAISGHNEENVTHEADCPWVHARAYVDD